MSTFLSAMMAAATGVAFTLFGTLVTGAEETAGAAVVVAAAAGSGFGARPAGLVALSSMSAKIAPIKILSPSVALWCKVPACSAFTSKVAFSLSNSAMTSSRST